MTAVDAVAKEGIYVGDGLPTLPPAPESIEETGLTLDFLADLTLKTLYVRGTLLGSELSDQLKLPTSMSLSMSSSSFVTRNS